MNTVTNTLAFSTLALYGLMAGFFYAFSVCVMGGLNRNDPDTAISAMQSINIVVRNPVFFVTFFLTPFVAIVTAATFFMYGERVAGICFAASAIVYFVGVIVVTMIVNVPMNTALEAVNPAAADNAMAWTTYSTRWTFWNTVRTFGGLVALIIGIAGFKLTRANTCEERTWSPPLVMTR